MSDVIQLYSLVAVQPGAIVSRVLVKNKAGNITVFAFDEGQELSEHTTPFEAFIQVLDGEADIRIAETTHRVGAGHAIVLPAGVPHAVKAPVPFKMMLVMLRGAVE
jgi:quercetin dioxygenase-like cupin family protein